MQSNLLKSILLSTLPIFAYIIADILLKNPVLSIIIAISIGIIEFIITLIVYKKIDFFIFVDILLISILGAISIIRHDPIFFKIKPAIIEGVILLFITGIGFSKKLFRSYITRFLKNIHISEEKLEEMQIVTLYFAPVLLLHIFLIIISAFLLPEKVWAFISTFLLYIMLGVISLFFVATKYIKKKLYFNKYKNSEWFDIVDENSNVLGKAPREICHNGSMLMHPVVHIHIMNSDKKLLLQKRALTKKIQPGKWDTSVGGHIMSGEPLISAIKREIEEEVGITVEENKLVPLEKYINQSEIEKELVFSFIYFSNDEIAFQKSEIDNAIFFDFTEVNDLILNNKTTPNFIQEFMLLKNNKIIKKLFNKEDF